MRKLGISPHLLLLLMFGSLQAFGGNWYVNKAASGANNGTDWTNAWTDFNQISFSSVACGDTIWVAGNNGGTPYSGSMTLSKVCTSGNVLMIRRVLSTDSVPVAAAGWNSTFDSQVVNSAGTTSLTGSYITVDGRVGDAATSVPYGIQWKYSTSGGVWAVTNTSNTINNITLTHVEIWGPPCATSGTCTGSTWGINLNQGQDNNTTIDHSWIHQFSEVIRPYETTGLTIQYSYIGEDVKVTSADHEDWIYASNPVTNLSLIGNRWYSSGNDGDFFDNAGISGMVAVNNLFFHWGFWAFSLGKTGTCGPYIIVNNTFANDSLGSDGSGNEYPYGVMGSGGCTVSTSSLVANNIFYNTSLDNLANSYTVYNAGTTSNGNNFSCGTGCFSYALASPIQSFNGFVNFVPAGSNSATIVTADFHLSSAGKTLFQGKGENLTSQCGTYPSFCTDLDGNARSASGAWTLGAYESSNTATVTPPTNLTAVVQ